MEVSGGQLLERRESDDDDGAREIRERERDSEAKAKAGDSASRDSRLATPAFAALAIVALPSPFFLFPLCCCCY